MSVKRNVQRKLERYFKEGNIQGILSLEKELLKVLDKPKNLILLSDAYKFSHPSFYGETMSFLQSYFEARGGMFGYTLWAGIQAKVKQYLEGVAITQGDVDEATEILSSKFGVFGSSEVFSRENFQYIVDVHGGKLPIRIKSVKEGTCVNHHNVLLTIEATDEKCAWLTNFLESLILQVWYPTTVATLSREVKKVVIEAFNRTSTLTGEAKAISIQLVLNDFGFRGVSSVESAEYGGFGHLINFDGSDNVISSAFIRDYYNTKKIYGKSVPATEHSVMTLRGIEGEFEMIERTLDAFPTGPVACVSDTYDIINAVEYIGTTLKDKVLSRPSEPGNCLIIRPDSGDINVTLIKIFDSLFKNFGYTTNSKGFKVLPPQVRVIQGDGVNYESIKDIYRLLEENDISAENIALGMGGKLLQADINRDTHKFAIKACFAIVDGKEINVVKSPMVFDKDGNKKPSFKTSKQGKLKLVLNSDGHTYRTVTSLDPEYHNVVDELQLIFENGVLYNETTFDEIRERAKIMELELV